MMFLLDLVRHADALPKAPGGGDSDRRLSPIGRRQSLMLGERVRERGSYPEKIWCSPAMRTRETLEALGYDFVSVAEMEPRIYEAGLDTLLDLIAQVRPLAGHAMLVGHNPGLQDLLTYLVGAQAPDVPTAALARVELPERPLRPLRASARLVEFWAP